MIEFSDIGRSFFGVEVLKRVTFAVPAGRTLGIVGENGAGKSTLMNILGGNLPPDTGAMRLGGRPYAPASPRDAEQAGIAFIHQELNLFPNLSIAENVFLRSFPRKRGWLPFIARRRMHERASALLEEVQLAHPPGTPVEQLSAGERQLVEIAKALALEARLIIFDEPTTSLTDRETARLFVLMKTLRGRGISMIYISHNLGHVLKLADEIVVLRDGQVVAAGAKPLFNEDRLVSLMVGREITQLYPSRETRPNDRVVLDVRGIVQPGIARNISFHLRGGEILGISGLMGSGRSELARILFGLDPCASGAILLDGQPLQRLPPRERIHRGLAFLTEDRRTEGLCMEASIADNITLAALERFAHLPARLVSRMESSAAVRGVRQAVRLTPTARDENAVKTLSGGNQQKVVLAKWLLSEPKVFILDEPTRGVDVGARHEVYRLINSLVARGAGVLMISSEVEELIGMCDRILVMRAGEIRATVEQRDFDRERILRAAIYSGGVA